MKIKTIKLFCIITLLFLASCTPEEKNNKATNPLTGTKWATSYADYYMVIEFTSENQVQGYFAKGSSLTYHNGLTNGSYSVSGSNVTFNNFDISLNSRMIKSFDNHLYLCVTTPASGHPLGSLPPFSSSLGIDQASLALLSLLRRI